MEYWNGMGWDGKGWDRWDGRAGIVVSGGRGGDIVNKGAVRR